MKSLLAGFILTAVLTSCGGSGSSDREVSEKDQFIDSLVQEMTLEEKIGQMTLFTSDWAVTGPSIRDNYKEDIISGRTGAVFNAHTAAYTRELQKMAVEESRLGIPLLFGYDVIHGHKTIFPIPLGEAASWDLGVIEKSARFSAMEAAAGGLHWTFNPMVDIARDPRWGRIAEGSGEDVYLGSLIAAAKVKGYQGNYLSDPLTVAACVKHFAAYGAGQAGRDYHFVDMSERVLRETYLPPYKAAIDAGAVTVMTSFNELDGVPVTGNSYLLQEILRDEWGFDGFVVTDYTSINEMVNHGIVADEKAAGELAVNAGVDMDMQGAVFYNYMLQSVNEGIVEEARLNRSVRDILEVKWQLGLFEDPYRYSNEQREQEVTFSQEIMDHARDAARRSIVLLKNDSVRGRPVLPLSGDVRNIALIGPLADSPIDMLGTWRAAGDETKAITLLAALRSAFPGARVNFVKGAEVNSDDKSGFAAAVRAAQSADVVILAVGESADMSGEAASRSSLDLPGVQQELVQAIAATGKPIVPVVMAGRPLTITWMAENMPAVVWAWHLGTMAGPAITDVLFGDYNPSGKLPVTFPRNVGQIPIHYDMKNTGRPFNDENKYTSKYLDVENTPLYAFGHGLSYSKFRYSNLRVNKSQLKMGDDIEVKVRLTNESDRSGEETVQLYIRDMVGSVTRPVLQLKGFQKVQMTGGESRDITFTLNSDDLRFYTRDMLFRAEPGAFKVFVGGSSADTIEGTFELSY